MPNDRIIAFLGPSLPRDRAEAVLAADYRAPAARGDVYRAACEAPCAILLIDGVFEDQATVLHNEILWALSEGIHVFGAASIGALRAAELDGFGMVGIGDIYEAYRNGGLDRDDAVAILHGPEALGYPPLSWALVDAWATFAEARRRDVIDDAQLALLNGVTETVFYKDRTEESVIDRAAVAFGADLADLASWIADNKVAQKGRDALSLLAHVGALGEALDTPLSPTFRFARTAAFERLKRDVDWRMNDTSGEEFAAIVEELRAADSYDAIAREAIAALLAEEAASERSGRFDDAALRRATPAFRRKHRLLRGEDVARWMAELDLSHADYVSMVSEDFYLDEAARRHASRLPDAILRVLRRRGQLRALRAKAHARMRRRTD